MTLHISCFLCNLAKDILTSVSCKFNLKVSFLKQACCDPLDLHIRSKLTSCIWKTLEVRCNAFNWLSIYHYRFCILDLCVTWLCVCVGFIVCRNVFCSRWFVSPFAVQLEILFLLGKIPIHEHMHLIPSVALPLSTDEMIESIYASPILYLPFDL